MPSPCYRRFCFTLNNHTPDDEQRLRDLASGDLTRYLIFGREVGDSGTPHLQGFVIFRGAKTFVAAKALINPRAHLEVARGTNLQAAQYCKKEDDFEQFGDMIGNQGKRTDWDEFKDWVIDQGRLPSKRDIAAQWTSLYARYPTACMEIAAAVLPSPNIVGDAEPRLGWQTRVMGIVDGTPNPRKIHFVVDAVGNSGKSWLCRYLVSKKPDDVQCFRIGRALDLAHTLDVSKSIFLVDVPRGQMTYLSYSFIESVKDQMIYSGKYQGSCKIIAHATTVIVFSNEHPDMNALSADRYSVINV